METQITITVTVTNITAAEMREHIAEVVTFIDSIECKEVSS